MAQTITEKLNKIYATKLQIKSALGTSSDVFEDYPSYIRDLTYGGAVSYTYLDERLSYYVETTDLESMGYITDSALSGYATESYVANYVYTYAPSPDLSAYVTKTELNNAGYLTSIPSDYATYAAIEAMGYITINDVPVIDTSSYVTYTYLESKEYLTEIPNTYATYAAIEGMGYVTSNDLPVINENIIPKENNTYTLGDASYLYKEVYSSKYWIGDNHNFYKKTASQINLNLNNSDRYVFHINNFSPANDNTRDLGTSDLKWRSTYTQNIYITNVTYLPVNTYWWNGTSYLWLGSLFS